MYSIIYNNERIGLICMQQEAWFSLNATLSSITWVHIILICYVYSVTLYRLKLPGLVMLVECKYMANSHILIYIEI